jgi:hypothetical protein
VAPRRADLGGSAPRIDVELTFICLIVLVLCPPTIHFLKVGCFGELLKDGVTIVCERGERDVGGCVGAWRSANANALEGC